MEAKLAPPWKCGIPGKGGSHVLVSRFPSNSWKFPGIPGNCIRCNANIMFFFLYSSSLITLEIPRISGSDLCQSFQRNFFSSSIKCGSQTSLFCPDPISKFFFSRSLNLIKRRGLFSCYSHSLNKIGVVNFIRALLS